MKKGPKKNSWASSFKWMGPNQMDPNQREFSFQNINAHFYPEIWLSGALFYLFLKCIIHFPSQSVTKVSLIFTKAYMLLGEDS